MRNHLKKNPSLVSLKTILKFHVQFKSVEINGLFNLFKLSKEEKCVSKRTNIDFK